jgi:putative ABC transport system permease protein
MSFVQLLLRNLAYHWRGNLAVFLGIVLGSAVLTGALLVGDSLRGSLKELTLDQLGWVEHALVPGRFFRMELANEIAADRRAAALVMQGSAAKRNEKGETVDRVGRVTVLGVDASFWPADHVPESAEFWSGEAREVVLNRTLANALKVKVGERIVLNLQREGHAPSESILGQRKSENVIEEIDVTIRAIVPDQGMARFSLKPTPEPVRNAFVPIRMLQARLELEGRGNALFAAQAKPSLQADLHAKLTLDDWGLRYRSPSDRAASFMRFLGARDGKVKRWQRMVPDALAKQAAANRGVLTSEMVAKYYEAHRDYWMLESRRMLLEPSVVNAVKRISPLKEDAQPRWRWTPSLIYLADRISDGTHETPYAIIASNNDQVIGDDQIILVDWPNSPIQAKPGDAIRVAYYFPDQNNHLEKREQTFKVHSVPKLEGVLDDPDLTPEFPGITDSPKMANWVNPPFPYDKSRVTKVDEDYWERYRTTPKAYVSLQKAQELWRSRFGEVTSIQVRAGLEHPDFFAAALLKVLQPEQGGFVFQPVREQALTASTGATDFGVLFLSFSFFLIVAALLLVGLLVRLNLDRRAREIGLLLATGWDHGRVRRLLLGEGVVLSVLGALVGLGGALLYGHLMLKMLTANWPGGDSLNFLRLHAEPTSFAIGYLGSLAVSLLTLYWATRVLGNLTPRSLLSGETTQTQGVSDARLGWSRWLIPVGVLGAIALAAIAKFLPSHEAQAGSFFGSGALMLTACLAAVWNGLKWFNRGSSPQPRLWRLALRNAGRHAVRSVLTVGLLASASFLIVAVESFHKTTDHEFLSKQGGSGGFALFAEGSVPIFEDLNQPKVRSDRELDTPELQGTTFFRFRVQGGDDASCLNLYKPLKPRVMGVPHALIERGGFHFAASASADANPWRLLEANDGDAIPVILDANTAMWILKVGLRDTIDINDESGNPVKLRVVGLLKESIFQSEVLVSDANFVKLFPRQEGFSFFLIETLTTEEAPLAKIEKQLGQRLDKVGLDVQTTVSRLQGYLAVENTYLATFQALGGLGLILGALGLAIVLLRGVWERRAELALLLALGFRSGQLAWLVLVENAFLLALGLACGTVSALLAVAPHLVGAGASVLWLRIAVLLALVLAVGLMSAALAVFATLRTPVLTALRRE